MALAVIGHTGPLPVMLLLLMLPQLVNFLVSIPQLFKLRRFVPGTGSHSGNVRGSSVFIVNDRATIVPNGMNAYFN